MSKPYFSKEPYHVKTIDGSAGGGGGCMRFLTGQGEPSEDEGMPGDVYLDTDSGDLYTNKNGVWELEINLKGPKGDPGEDGKDGEDGEQGPKGDKGDPGEDGFGTEEQYNDIISRLEALEDAL